MKEMIFVIEDKGQKVNTEEVLIGYNSPVKSKTLAIQGLSRTKDSISYCSLSALHAV